MIANDMSKFLSFLLQLTTAGLTIFILKKTHFVQDVLFYPKNEVMVFLWIETTWDWVSDVHVYNKSEAVIWFWQYVRTRQTSEN